MAVLTPGIFPINPNVENGTDLANHLNELVKAILSTNSSATRPAVLQRGGLWAKTGTGNDIALMFFDGTTDHQIGSITGGNVSFGAGVPANATAPTGPTAGALWVDTSAVGAPVLKVYTGTAWQTVSGSYLALAGGTMTGAVTLSGAPTADLHAATKKYVDDADALLVKKTDVVTTGGTATQAGKVPGLNANGKIDSTMLPAAVTGAMTLKGAIDPASAVPAAAKQGDYYVASVAGTSTWPGINGAKVLLGDSLLFDGANWHIIPTEGDLSLYLPLAGGTLTGPLTLSGAPSANLHGATKKYVDDQDALSVKLTGVSATPTANLLLQLDATAKFPAIAIPDLSATYLTPAAANLKYVQIANFNTLGDARYVQKTDLINSGGGVAGAVGKVVQVGAGGYISTSFFKTTDTGGAATQAGFFPILGADGKLSQQMLDTIATAATPTTAGAAKLVLTSGTGKIDNSLLTLPGVLTLKGTIAPTAAAPATAVDGDVFVVNTAGSVGTSWGAPAAGTAAAVGDLMIRVNGAWELLSSTGNLAFLPLAGGTLTGDFGVNGNTVLGASGTNTITFRGRVAGSMIPSVTNTTDLGSGALSYKDVYAARGLFGDGTQALPSIAFASDLDTGIWHPAPDTLAASTGGTERMRIDSSGNVGIGTSSPGVKLDVVGGMVQQSKTSGDNNAFYGSTSDTSNNYLRLQNTTGTLDLTCSNALSYLVTTQNGPLYFGTNNTERMRIDSSGNVGIGITNPSAYGRLVVGDTSNTTNNIFQILTRYATVAIVADATTAANGAAIDVSWHNGGQGPLRFTLASSEKMRIDSSGNVGIGVKGPTEMLHVAGNILATGNVTAYSDERLKEDIQPIPDALDKVLSLNGVTYTRNDLDDTTRRYAGLIAQDVQAVLPEAISDSNGTLALDYNATIGLLVESIKELTARVAKLEGN